MGIIHRDISPDNIIFRDRDKLPVLIDFGVVKAGVTQLEVSTQIHQGTTVGKAGYAPGEQLQTGEAYANSDLYALAVTVVVMMTGRKPESLIDKSTMTWKWHQWVPTLTPWFAKILNKMLSRVPNSRYQSANEVAQALRSVSDFVGVPATAAEFPSGTFVPSTPNSRLPQTAERQLSTNGQAAIPLSRLKRPQSNFGNRPPAGRTLQPAPQNPLRGILNTPWGLAIGAAAAALIVIVLPIFVISRSLMPSGSATKPVPVPTATSVPPPVVASPVPPPPPAPVLPDPVTPTAPPAPVAVAAETLNLEIGKALVNEGALNAAQPTVFSLNLPVGQQLKTTLTTTPPGATMNILAPNQANVDVYAKSTLNWQGTLPLTGEYRIEIISPPGTSGNYKLEVLTTALPTSATPTIAPTAAPTSAPTNAPTKTAVCDALEPLANAASRIASFE